MVPEGGSAGHSDAQALLGEMYDQGKAVTQDSSMAAEWYSKPLGLSLIQPAAEPGSPPGP